MIRTRQKIAEITNDKQMNDIELRLSIGIFNALRESIFVLSITVQKRIALSRPLFVVIRRATAFFYLWLFKIRLL